MLAEALICLALTVYHEARDQSLAEQAAVASVVLNRRADDRFPDTVCGVVRQGGERPRFGCQFSWYCDGRPDRPREEGPWLVAVTIARLAMEGVLLDNTDGALFYRAKYAKRRIGVPDLEVTRRDGAHIFYRERRANR